MAPMEQIKEANRPRRSFTDEFRAGAVRLVLDEGKTIAQVARDLDLGSSVLSKWVTQARADRSNGKTGLTTEERAELSQLRRENRQLKMERDLLNTERLLRQGDSVKFALVNAEKADYSIAKMCSLLGVSRSGFYAWCGRPPSMHACEDNRLRVLVRESHERSRKRYGSPRVHRELAKHGVHVSRKRVVRLMQAEELVARKRRCYKCTTMSDHDQPVAANLLERRFEAAAPNQLWVGDTTELLVGASDAKLYLAVILDLFSRFVVGWALSAVNDRHLTIKALDMALRRRCPDAGLLHHSDQGSTYASEDYQKILVAHDRPRDDPQALLVEVLPLPAPRPRALLLSLWNEAMRRRSRDANKGRVHARRASGRSTRERRSTSAR